MYGSVKAAIIWEGECIWDTADRFAQLVQKVRMVCDLFDSFDGNIFYLVCVIKGQPLKILRFR